MRTGLLLLCLALAGCDTADPPAVVSSPPPRTGELFAPTATAVVRGRVSWRGDVPPPTTLESVANPNSFGGPDANVLRQWPNPNEPRVRDGRLAGAFVWLEGIDPLRARRASLPVVRLELAGHRMSPTRGLVLVGGEVEVVSHDPSHHSLQGRGANFFALTLPPGHGPRRRTLDTAGLVEVRSGSGQFWVRSYLLVQPHSYMAVTDDRGEFAFDQVPEGEHTLVVWHPDRRIVARDRNPDNFRIVQVTFGPGLRLERRVAVQAGRAVVLDDLQLGE